jgi:hypothetical protein
LVPERIRCDGFYLSAGGRVRRLDCGASMKTRIALN